MYDDVIKINLKTYIIQDNKLTGLQIYMARAVILNI